MLCPRSSLQYWVLLVSLFACSSQAFANLSVTLTPYVSERFWSHSVDLDYINYPQMTDSHLSWGSNFKASDSLLRASVQSEIRYGINSKTFSFEVPEIYLGARAEGTEVSIGRKVIRWSRLDDDWKFGIWQSRFRGDYLSPTSVGFFGLHASQESSWFSVKAFASPFFIPDRGVPLQTEGGALLSSSPWFITPPSQVSLFGQNTPIRYQLDVPPMKQIIFNPVFSAQITLGQPRGPWFSAGTAVKPMNQLLLAYAGTLKLSANSGSQALVNIVPRVMYHNVVSFEGGFEGEGFGTVISYLYDRPMDLRSTELNAALTSQQVALSQALSWSVKTEFTLIPHVWIAKPSLSLLRQFGGQAPDLGPDANSTTSFFEARYPYEKAWKGRLDSDLIGRKLTIGAEFLHDIENEGSLLSLEVITRVTSRFALRGGCDVLGSDSQTPDSNFIGRYRARDRVYAGASYEF